MTRPSFAATGRTSKISTAWADSLQEVVDRGIPATPQDHGASASASGSANSAALVSLGEALTASGNQDNSSYIATAPVFIPNGDYSLADTWDFNFGTAIVTGNSTGSAGANGTQLTFAADKTGIRVQRADTSGADTTDLSFHVAGDGSIISRLTLIGSGSDEGAHGLHLRARAFGQNLRIHGFPGNGVNIVADINAGPAYGNANCSALRDSRITGCLNGILTSGGDANACLFEGLDLSANQRFGVAENSFLGNAYVGFHAADNGLVVGTTPGLVHYSGGIYGVIYGQEAWCKTNAPSGDGSDNTGWYYQGAGAASPGNNINDWASGTDYVATGSVLCKGQPNNCSVFVGGYHEGGQGLPQIDSPSLIVGGILATVRNVGTAGRIYSINGGIGTNGLYSESDILADGALTISGNAHDIGPQAGDAVNTVYNLHATGDYIALPMYSHNGGLTKIVEWGCQRAVGSYVDLSGTAGGSHKVYFNGGGITSLESGSVKINGTKVIGTQGAAVADATDAASAITQLNLALARLRAHGLIA